MKPGGRRGISLTDLLVTIAVLALLVYLARLGWRRPELTAGRGVAVPVRAP